MNADDNPPDPGLPRLGDCLRAVRRARGLTLKQVEEATGLALSTLSKVENHQMSLTYDKMLQLCRGLGMDIAALLGAAAAPPAPLVTARRSISRAGDGQRVSTAHYDYLYQFGDLTGKRMVPIMAEVRARSLAEFGPLIRHSGEEYFLVLEGRVLLHTEFYAPEVLSAGEGVYLDSNMGHAYLTADETPARGICVCTGEGSDLAERLMAASAPQGAGAASAPRGAGATAGK
ncbi:helix-turn-helix transcriptional regulator [Acetobacteraceae bacterium H6797]|nr:helix-turn-helix transcriptional regulator [Acetobacteraceae bacterium H6797]